MTHDRRTFWRWVFDNCPWENLFAFRLAYERMTGQAIGALILAARLDIHHGYLEAPHCRCNPKTTYHRDRRGWLICGHCNGKIG